MPADPTGPERRIVPATEVAEGVGARVKRVFPTNIQGAFDPFVVLDEFRVGPPAGFPDHPHRGFEIVTYVLEGAFRHQDNLGNDSVVQAGGVQRITAGAGIVHSEMPHGGVARGLQLWINLPPRLKRVPPAYQPVPPGSFPVERGDGAELRTIVGANSPVELQTPVRYIDARLDRGGSMRASVPDDWNSLLYVLDGSLVVDGGEGLAQGHALLTRGGGPSRIAATGAPAHAILLAGRPHHEPIRQYGPFVD